MTSTQGFLERGTKDCFLGYAVSVISEYYINALSKNEISSLYVTANTGGELL